MKALTLWPEYAWLIAKGIKTTETRWAPPGWLLGSRIAIHAGKRKPRHTMDSAVLARMEDSFGELSKTYLPLGVATRLPRGVIVATARLVSAGKVVQHEDNKAIMDVPTNPFTTIRRPIDPYGDYSVGRWIWFLEDIRELDEPIPARVCSACGSCRRI